MKVCLYIRLSSADDDIRYKSESESISNQRVLLQQYLKNHEEFHPYEIVEFVDDGFSGTNGNRPAFEKMITYLKDGGSKLVLCKDLSRFFRDYVEIGDYLERIFPIMGIRFIAVNDGYDSNDYIGTTGGIDVVMKCIVYGFYSRDLSQKVKTVLNAKSRKGQYIGSFPPYGYLKDPEDRHHLVPDPVASKVVRRIFDLAIAGTRTGDIARLLNRNHVETPAAHHKRMYPESNRFKKGISEYNSWDVQNVYTILHRREYTGAVVSGQRNWKSIDHQTSTMKDESEWIIVPNCHEAIVSEEEFRQARNAIRTVGKAARGKKDYLLRSLVHCGCCGRIMNRSPGRRVDGDKPYYKCTKNSFVDNSPCPLDERFYEDQLETVVIQSLSQMLQLGIDERKKIQEATIKTKGTADHLRRKIQQTELSLSKLSADKLRSYEQYSDGLISRDDFMSARNRIVEETRNQQIEKSALEEELAAIEKANTAGSDPLSEAEQFLMAKNVTNEMLLKFIERVNVYTGMRVEIVYRFDSPFTASETH